MKIDKALKLVEEKIVKACHRIGRDENSVKLVAVSKTFPIEYVHLAYKAGQRIFGESRAQEFREKVKAELPGIEWHFIGHLQTNKIKYVAPKANLIHAVDSMHLAGEISDYAVKNHFRVPLLLQVNTSAEESKFGLEPDEAEEMFLQINENLPGVQLRGLMCMAPFVDDERVIRSSFSRLRNLQEKLQKHVNEENIRELSMGMSHDYELAVEEGSTLVRVGTAIFGSRGR